MKIMLVCDSMGIGGAETHVLGLATGLCAKGHAVTVAARNGELAPRLLRECKGRGRFVELYPRGRSAFELAAYIVALEKLIKREDPAVIHAHSRVSAFAVGVLRSLGYIKKRNFAVTAHAKYRTNAVLKLFSVWGDACIAVSDDIRAHLEENFCVAEERISVIPNGIDTCEFRPMPKTPRRSILFASRLDEDSSHGAYCLCKIADDLSKKYPDLKITVAGGGSELSELKKCAKNKNITFSGALPSLFGEISDAELVIGVSRVALEGMSCEKNVILFGNEGALGILDETNLQKAADTNFTCRGFGIRDESYLRDEIDRFFSMSDEQRLEMAKNNRRYILDHHSQIEAVDRTLAVYRNMLFPMPKILVGGYYGFENMGDDALLSVLLGFLKSRSPRARVCVLNRIEKQLGGVRYVNRYSPISLAREMMRADVFILGGGSLLQNGTSTRSLLYYCALVHLSKALGCKCILLSNGIGPLHNRLAENLAAITLKKADHVSLRDEKSLAIAKALGRRDATLGADLCFSMNAVPKETVKVKAVKSAAKNGHVIVALKGTNSECNIRLLKELRRFCLERGLTPVFVAMDKLNDTRAARIYAAECGGVFAEDLKVSELFALLSDAEAVIGERLHFLIFSLAVGRSFVGVGNAPKITSFVSETLNMPTLDPRRPSDLDRFVDEANSFSSSELVLIWQKYKKRSEYELHKLKKAFFV